MAEDNDLGFEVDPPPKPGEVSPTPESVDDYTGSQASGRTLFWNGKRFKFGINDKTLSIAFLLTVTLLFFILIFGIASIFAPGSTQVPEILDALIKALFMAIGVIVGRNIKE